MVYVTDVADVPALLMVRFPGGIEVAADLLGTSWPIEGLPAECRVVLPAPPHDLGDDFTMPHLALPPAEDVQPGLDALQRSRSGMAWGRVMTRSQGHAVSAHVDRVAVVARCGGPGGEWRERRSDWVDDMVRALHEWTQRLLVWLEVSAGIDVRNDEPPRTTWDEYVDGQVLFVPEGEPFVAQVARLPLTFSAAESPAVGSDAWSRSVSHASAATLPPFAHLLLADARAAVRRRDMRRAVIEAGTAAEVVLAEVITANMAGGPEEIDRVTQASGAMGLYDLAAALGVWLPVSRERVAGQLAGPRNAAAHAGLVPTREVLGRALSVAASLVTSLSPLP